MKRNTSIDVIVEIESARVRKKLPKGELASRAGIKPNMYSYLLRCGREGLPLPQDTLDKVRSALRLK